MLLTLSSFFFSFFFPLKIGCSSNVLGASRGINIPSHCFVFKIWLPHDRQPKNASENRSGGRRKQGRMGNKRAAFRVIRWFQCSFWQGAFSGETWPPCADSLQMWIWRRSRESSQRVLGCPCVPTELWDFTISPSKPLDLLFPPDNLYYPLCLPRSVIPTCDSCPHFMSHGQTQVLKIWFWGRQEKWVQCTQGQAGAQIQNKPVRL